MPKGEFKKYVSHYKLNMSHCQMAWGKTTRQASGYGHDFLLNHMWFVLKKMKWGKWNNFDTLSPVLMFYLLVILPYPYLCSLLQILPKIGLTGNPRISVAKVHVPSSQMMQPCWACGYQNKHIFSIFLYRTTQNLCGPPSVPTGWSAGRPRIFH